MDKTFYVYMLASERNGTLYLGVISNLVKRIRENWEGLFEGFTKRYGIKYLVWFDIPTEVIAAITLEKQLLYQDITT